VKTRRSYYYGQVVQSLEYNPRLFLYLLIFAVVVVYAYQFATQLSTQWMVAGFASLGILAGLAIMVWPFQSVMLYLGLAIWYHSFLRGGTMVGMGSALVYPGDVFVGAFMAVEFFRGCMRQTHLYTATDRWMVALYVWALCCIARGTLSYGYSAVGEAREFLHCISYFIAIHYITRMEQTETVLRWLKWICIITAVWQFYVVVLKYGFIPRFAGGNLLNEYGCLNIVVLGVLLGRDHIKSHRTLAGFGIIVLLVLTFYSAMRAVVASVLITIPFLLWITRRYFLKTVLMGVVAIALGIVVVGVMSPLMGGNLGDYFAKVYRGIIDPSQDPTGAWRLYGWRWEMQRIFSNPFWVLIGQGFGGYYEWYFGLVDEIIKTGVHNQFIQFWSKMGLVGVGLFFSAIISFFIQGLRFLQKSTNELQRSFMMILMLIVLGNLVDMWVGQSMITLWPILAIGTALPRLWLGTPANAPVINVAPPMRSRPPLGALRRPSGQPTAYSR